MLLAEIVRVFRDNRMNNYGRSLLIETYSK